MTASAMRTLLRAGAVTLLAWPGVALAQPSDGTSPGTSPRSLQPEKDPGAIQSEPLPPPAEAAPPETPPLAAPGGVTAAPGTSAPEAAAPETTMTPPAADAAHAAPEAAAKTLLLSPDWQPRQKATLQALDKHDLRVGRIEVPVGQNGQFGTLSITVRACLARPPDQAMDAAALLQISDSRATMPAFSGWMFAAEPALAILEDPIYDIRVLACH